MEETLYRMNPWWTEEFRASGIERAAYVDALLSIRNVRDIVFITGLRRTGKTTIMHQMIERLLSEIDPKMIFYVSLDNYALKDHSILEIVDEYRRLQGLSHRDSVHLFLDEVHAKKDFEIQLKNLYDMGRAKIWASGSGSLEVSMRSPYLTGRQRVMHVYPLNFEEYLLFTGKKVSPADSHLLVSIAEEYVKTGGIPEYVLTEDLSYLQSLLETIIYRDVAGKHGIRNVEKLEDMLQLIAQGVGSPLSIRKISRVLGMSKEDVSRAISLFMESDLLYPVEREGKVSERKASPRKFYLSDTGFFLTLTDKINTGAMVENSVFLNLLRRKKKVRYLRESGKEIDFVVEKELWESKYRDDIEKEDVQFLLSLKGYGKKAVITKKKEDRMESAELIPLWKFLKTSE